MSIKATRKQMCVIDAQGGIYSYVNSKYVKRGDVVYRINTTEDSLECTLESNLVQRLLQLKESAEEKFGVEVEINNIVSENHLESIWYEDGTELGTLKYGKYVGRIKISGNPCLVVYQDKDEFTYSALKGDKPEELMKAIKDDEEFEHLLQDKIYINENNYIICRFEDLEGNKLFIEDDVFGDNVLDPFEDVEWFIDRLAEELKKGSII